MTDMENQTPVDSQPVQNVASESSTNVQQDASPAHVEEKMLKQSEVNEIASRVRHQGYEKGKQEALAEYQKGLNNSQNVQQSQPNYQTQQPQSLGGIQQLSEEHIRKLIADETTALQQRQAQMAVANQIANDFIGKMGNGKSKYSDFEQLVGDTFGDFQEFPEIVHLANNVDNTSDVVYALAQNPSKIGNLLSLLQRSPKLALADMQALSRSIKNNEQGQAIPKANEPLSQVTPSNKGVGDDSSSVSALRKQSWLRA